jgi:hypothetical protein
MDTLFKPLLDLPADVPAITTEVMLNDEKTLITGHENGDVICWNLQDGSHKKILSFSTSVKTISYNDDDDEILIGYYSGGLYLPIVWQGTYTDFKSS